MGQVVLLMGPMVVLAVAVMADMLHPLLVPLVVLEPKQIQVVAQVTGMMLALALVGRTMVAVEVALKPLVVMQQGLLVVLEALVGFFQILILTEQMQVMQNLPLTVLDQAKVILVVVVLVAAGLERRGPQGLVVAL